MDEPASALDPIATAKVEDLVSDLRKSFTIVIVTHNMQQAARVSQRTGFFYMGSLVEIGETSQIFTRPKERHTEDYITGPFRLTVEGFSRARSPRRRKTVMRFAPFIALVALAACTRTEPTTGPAGSASTTAAADKTSISIKGSDTMVILGQRWAETYMKTNAMTITVTGGGSGTGIAALINGTTDICEASRPMKDKEKDDVKPSATRRPWRRRSLSMRSPCT